MRTKRTITEQKEKMKMFKNAVSRCDSGSSSRIRTCDQLINSDQGIQSYQPVTVGVRYDGL